MEDAQWSAWRTKLSPYLYDWIANHKLTWPSQTCRWGPKLEDHSYKSKYKIYLSEQTDNSEPQKLIIADTVVCKVEVASIETIAAWTDMEKCPYIREQKVIFHPGEVNKIREIPQQPDIVVTHTDAPELYVWNVEKQPHRSRDKGTRGGQPPADSVADLVLTGHEDTAQFPLATTGAAPFVASGGNDTQVLLWNLEDSMSGLLAGPALKKESPRLEARTHLRGHSATVEDVVFKPMSTTELLSVGDDQQVLMWDTRKGQLPASRVTAAHGKVDIQCCDWSSMDHNMTATGAQDGSLKVWDVRKLGSNNGGTPLFHFTSHKGGILRLEWNPVAKGVLASGAEDRVVLVWKLEDDEVVNPAPPKKTKMQQNEHPPQLMFQHVGHRRGKVVDFQWLAGEPWTMLSVSDDMDEEDAGGTLQMWRISPLIWRPEAEAIAELEKHKEFILHGRDPPPLPSKKEKKSAPAATPAAAATAAAGPSAPTEALVPSLGREPSPPAPPAEEAATVEPPSEPTAAAEPLVAAEPEAAEPPVAAEPDAAEPEGARATEVTVAEPAEPVPMGAEPASEAAEDVGSVLTGTDVLMTAAEEVTRLVQAYMDDSTTVAEPMESEPVAPATEEATTLPQAEPIVPEDPAPAEEAAAPPTTAAAEEQADDQEQLPTPMDVAAEE